MKILETLNAVPSPDFEASVRQKLWAAWQRDPYLPATEDDPSEMSPEDQQEFEDHVSDIVKFAKRRGIVDAREAIVRYHAVMAADVKGIVK